MNNARSLLNALKTEGPAAIGRRRRVDSFSEDKVRRIVTDHLAALDLPEVNGRLILSLALLWHDHLEASHDISQDIGTADGSFVHGIMHRREPDIPNARYWFGRVGAHPAFPHIARRVRNEVLPLDDDGLIKDIAPDADTWDPATFAHICETTLNLDVIRLLERVQEIEYETLMLRFHGEPPS